MPAKAAEWAASLLLTHCSLLLKTCEKAVINRGLCQFRVLNCCGPGEDDLPLPLGQQCLVEAPA